MIPVVAMRLMYLIFCKFVARLGLMARSSRSKNAKIVVLAVRGRRAPSPGETGLGDRDLKRRS
jgi:hypothetical protein